MASPSLNCELVPSSSRRSTGASSRLSDPSRNDCSGPPGWRRPMELGVGAGDFEPTQSLPHEAHEPHDFPTFSPPSPPPIVLETLSEPDDVISVINRLTEGTRDGTQPQH